MSTRSSSARRRAIRDPIARSARCGSRRGVRLPRRHLSIKRRAVTGALAAERPLRLDERVQVEVCWKLRSPQQDEELTVA
jgi:hypothetical protein